MRRRTFPTAMTLVLVSFLAGSCASASRAPAGASLPYLLRPVAGVDECLEGDSLRVTGMEGSQPEFVAGGTYRVRGTWTLESRDAAQLELWVMNGETTATPSMAIRRGSGNFDFTFTLVRAGYPHLSLYPEGGGAAIGAAFFGTGDESTWTTAFER